MNKGSFRLVYNRLRGMLLAVEETASSTGKGQQSATRAARRSRHARAARRPPRVALPALPFALLASLLASFGLAVPAGAQIVADPNAGANRPGVIQTSNGLPQVNITRPSGAGVSTNAYTQFDVPRGGAILNNSPTIVSTQQAGFVNGNPNLLPGQNARIIVNQVTSTLPSQLRGYLEVAGGRAEVVVANPNGIMVDGGGFINTSRATLTTGVPVFGGTGSLDAFRVTGGQISLQGAGLNAANVDQVDLIARSVTANAALYANRLNVVAGASQVDRATLAATPIAGSGPAPGVAIDVSQLGGMYANKILLVGTEAGVGVSNRGVLAAQAGDLTLDAQGRLALAGKTSAAGTLAITARAGVDNSGTTYGAQAVSLDTAGTLANSGTLAAQQALRVNAGSVASSGTLGAGVNGDGTIGQQADLSVSAAGVLSANGRNVAGGNASLQGAALNLAGSQTTALGNLNLAASAGDMDLSGARSAAGGAITADAQGALVNDRGQLSSQGATTVTAASVSNQGGRMLSQGAATLRSAGAVNNAQGELQAGGALSVDAGALDNTAGRLVSLNGDGLSLSAKGALTNAAGATASGTRGGVIGGNGAVQLSAGALANHGEINAQTAASLDAQSLDNDRGSIVAGDALTATVAGAASNRQGTMAGAALALSAHSLDNAAGRIEGDALGLRTAGDLSNRGGAINQFGQTDTAIRAGGALDNTAGTLASNGQNLTLDAQSLANDGGRIAHAGTGTLSVTSRGALRNAGGTIQGNGALDAQLAGALTNTAGRIEVASAHGPMSLAAASVDNTGGRIVNAGDGLTRVQARQALFNGSGGLIGGNGKVRLSAGALANHGQVTARGDASLDAQSLDNDQGSITAGDTLTATVADAASNRRGTMAAATLALSAHSLDNSAGRIEGDALGIRTAGDLSNRGGAIHQLGQADTAIRAGGALDNTAGTLASNGQNLTLDARSLANHGGHIAHAGTGRLAVTSQGTLGNTAGTIRTNGALAATAASLDNTRGTLAAQADGTLSVQGALDNTQATIHAGGTLQVQADGALTNTGGRIEAAGAQSALSLAAGSVDNTGGRIVNAGDGLTRVQAQQALLNANPAGTTGTGLIGGNGKVQLSAGALANHGQVTARGDASLDAQSLDNDQGSITAGGTLAATIAGTASNRQGTLSGGVADLSAASLDNGAGRIEGDQVAIRTTGTLSNRGGTINQFGKTDTAIRAGGAFDNTSGTLATNGQNLTVQAQSLANDSGRIAHAGNGTLAVTSRGALGNTAGAILSNGTLKVQAASLDNSGATLSAQGAASLAVGGDLSNRQGRIYGQSGLTLASQGLLDNTGGTAQTGGDLTVSADGKLSNAGGTLTANGAHGKAAVAAAGIDNRGGRIANAGDGATTITAAGALDNAGGTLGGNGAVTLAATDLANSAGGQVAAAGALTIGVTRGVDNRGGSLYGGQGLTLDQAGATLANDGGTVLGGTDVTLAVASMRNQGGAVRANRDIGVSGNTGGISGSGEMTAGRNLSLRVAGDYTNDAANQLRADGDLQLSAGGTLTNRGKLAAGGNLAVRGADVTNAAGAGLNAQATTVQADNAIVNAGRIEGNAVNTLSATLANTGSVIGNTVTVQATDVSNTGAAAVIAAAQDLKVYASNAVSNLDGALLYSAGNLQIARDGTRDAGSGLLVNQVNVLNNRSAVIEADGDIDIAARTVNNTRTSIVTEAGTPQTSTQTLTAWYGGMAGPNRQRHKSLTFPGWDWDGQSASISANLMNALRSPVTIEVPKSTVTQLNSGARTLSFSQVPIETYVNFEQPVCNDNGCTNPPPVLTRPITTNATQYYQDIQDTGTTYKITFWPDWDPAKHIRPDQVRVRYDLGPDVHDYSEITRTSVTTTATDRLVSATPEARVQAQGAIRINSNGGTILNQSSVMAAGGDLIRHAANGGAMDIGTVLQQTVSTTDTSTFYWHQKSGGNSDTQTVPYPTTPQTATTVASLPALATSNQTVHTVAQDVTVGSVNRVGETVTGSGVGGGGASGTQLGNVSGTVAGGTPLTAGDAGNVGAASGAAGPAPTLGAGAVAAATGNTSRPQTLGTAAGGIPNLTLPVNGLFTLRPAPATPYLIETDSRFTQHKTFLSSDYMLGALGLDPQQVQKRLGDGFYEEKLVRDQVTSLTGRTFLAGYTDQTQAYQDLMNSGVTYAKAFGLVPGIGLSDEQMRQLTTDMVWLVAQDVTLPDGTRQSVLMPKLYLAQASAVDLNHTGALVMGKTVALEASGNLDNSGRIVGDVATKVLGNNIVNRGAIGDAGGTTVVQALQDVRNLGGRIGGQDVLVQAGRDVVNETQTITEVRAIGPNGYSAGATGVGAVAAISATNNAVVLAGRDVTLSGAVLEAGKGALIGAGRDLSVGAVTLGTTQDAVSRGGQSYSHDQTTTSAGSLIQAGGNVVAVAGRDATLANAGVHAGVHAGGNASVVAGRDLTVTAAKDTHTHSEGSLGGKGAAYTQASTDETARGSTVQAGNNVTLAAGQAPLAAAVLQANRIEAATPTPNAGGTAGNLAILGSTVTTGTNGNGGGTASLVAAGDITVGTVNETHTQENRQEHKRSGFLSSEQSTSKSSAEQNYAVGSTVSADAISGRAGRDLTVSGANLVASEDLALRADRNLTIGAAQDTATSSSAEEKRKSGMFSGGGLSVTIGKQQLSQAQQASTVTHVGSMVGSLNGNVSLSAGEAYKQTGSTVSALQGDVDIRAKTVDINAATDSARSARESHFRQSGLTVTVTNPVLAAAQTTEQMARAQSQTSDPRLKAMAAAATGLAVSNAADAVKADPKTAGGINISVSVGASRSDSQQTQSSATAVGSTVRAGGDVRIRAEGGGTDSNINVAGSNIQAGNNALLKADNQVNLLAAQNTAEQQSSNRSVSGGVGIALSLGAQGVGFGVTANAAAARGNADGNDVSWTNSHVNAGNTLVIDSGGDTTLRGATASGKQVIADVGGNLNIESLQDTSRYKSKDQSASASAMVGMGVASASANVSQQKIDSDYASVTEQSGIRAGSGGYQIDVKGNTGLKGAVIAGGTADKNSLSTGTLTVSDIRNHAEYSASSVSLGGGYTQGPPRAGSQDGGVGLTQGGQAATGEAVPGTSLPTSGGNGQGASFAPPIVMAASGSASSTTASGISAGSVTIRNDDKQKELTGKDAAETIASLNRDTDNTANALKPIFDEKEIKAGFEIVGALQREAGAFLNNRAKEAEAAKKVAEAVAKDPSATPEQRAEAQQRADDAAKWGQGGTYRQVMTALTAAAGGNVTGSAAQFAQGAAVGYIQGLAAGQVKAMADSLGKDTPGAESARAALHAIVGCAGAAAASQSCGAGAMGAAASSVLGSLLAPTDKMSAQEKQAREDMVRSLVAGVAGVAGANAATATNAATFEVENNQAGLIPAPPPIWTPGQPQKPGQIPGYKGEKPDKGAGVIADPATEIDAREGVHATPSVVQKVLDLIFTPVWEDANKAADSILTKSDDAASRPSSKQSENDVGADLGPGHRSQISYKDGKQVPYGTPGSVRPDHVANDGTASFEVKNYNIATNSSGLINTVAKQAVDRANNLPSGMEQQVIIDIRGQAVTVDQERGIIRGIVEKSNGAIRPDAIEFKRK